MAEEIISRGLAFDVDSPTWTISSVAFAIISTVAMFVYQPNDQKPKKTQRRRDVLAYTVIFSVLFLIIGIFLNAKQVLLQRISEYPFYPSIKDLPIALASFSICTLSRLILVPLFAMAGRKLLSHEKWGNDHELHVQRFAGQLWKVLFHSTVTIIPLVILRGQLWWPPGRGESSLIWESYPKVPQVPWNREYYMFQLGYYVHAMLVTLIQRGRPNYIQMVVHHVATIGLVVVSYFLQNNVRFGTIVFWLHDVCDVPVCLTRLVVDLSWAAPTAIFYIWLMVSWAYYRLYVFPVKTVWAVAVTCFTKDWVKDAESYGWRVTTPLLVTLIAMHWIWFYELAQMCTVYFKTGKREDSTDSSSIHGK